MAAGRPNTRKQRGLSGLQVYDKLGHWQTNELSMRSSSNRDWHFRLAALAAVLVTACTTPLPETSLDNPEELPERFGVAAVQVVSNTRKLGPMLYNWDAIYAIDLDDTEQRYILRPSRTGLLRSRVFIGALPPGHYAIFNLNSTNSIGDTTFWINAPIPRSIGSFMVDENRITSLGTIVYQPLVRSSAENEDQGKPYLVSRFDDMDDLTPYVAEAYPDIYGRLDDSVLLGWQPGTVADQQREELAELLPAASVAMNHVAPGERYLAIAGTLGQIFWRERQTSEWSRVDTGYTQQLAALTATPQGFLAGGERGLVLEADTLAGPWTQHPGPGTQEAVFWLHAEDDGSTFALARGREGVRFYSVGEDFTDWEELAFFETDTGNFSYISGRSNQVHAVVPGNGTIVLFGDKQRLVYRIADGHIETGESPNFLDVALQQNGIVVGLRSNFWVNVGGPRYSLNHGRDWQRIRQAVAVEQFLPQSLSVPLVTRDGVEYAVSHRGSRNERTRRIEYSETPWLRRMPPDSRDLEWLGEMQAGCTTVLAGLSSPERIYAACNDGRLLKTEDYGASWILDHESGMSEQDAPEALQERNLVHRSAALPAIAATPAASIDAPVPPRRGDR